MIQKGIDDVQEVDMEMTDGPILHHRNPGKSCYGKCVSGLGTNEASVWDR